MKSISKNLNFKCTIFSLKPIFYQNLSFFFLFCFLFSGQIVLAQGIILKGKVIDGETGEGIPFANVYLKSNLQTGTTTDFEGYYSFKISSLDDSVIVSYIGYIKKTKALSEGKKENTQLILNFQLESENTKLNEIVFVAGEDPSYPIMRKVIENKEKNDKRKLEEYEYESYVKIELDVDNISNKFAKKRFIRKVTEKLDSVGGLTGEDGKRLIPLFMSETISTYYYRKNPERRKENILKTKVQGVGFGPEHPISQILGTSFQEYSFYRNWVLILEKDFASPIADGWKTHYDYYLADSMQIGEHFCYKIEVYPKREQDLAFEGIIWIDSKSYALKQIDVHIGKKANINFIEKIRIQQELAPTTEGPWLPIKTRVLVDITEITKNSAGVIAKFYNSTKDIELNKKHPIKFYEEKVEVDMNAARYEKDYWQKNRHDSLTLEEERSYALIDTINNVPIIKTYTELAYIFVTGYYTVGPIDFGNYLYTYANNNLEGFRLRLGLKTNEDFSRLFEFKGYLAYGFKDERFKYAARFKLIPSRKRWTEIALERSEDISQIAANPDGVNIPGAFLSALYFGNVSGRSPFWRIQESFSIQRDLFKGFTQSIRFRHAEFQQIGNHFAYYSEPGSNESPIKRNYTISELSLETRLAKDESYYFAGNERFSIGTRKLPIVKLRYTLGLKGVMGSSFEYHKFAVSLEQNVKMGTFGNSYYNITAGYTPSVIPYPLQEIHLGNRSNFYNFYGFNLMNFLEFVSDRHILLNYEHNFNGLMTNRIPLMKKLKLRTFAVANVLVGGLSEKNRLLIPATDLEGNELIQPRSLGSLPYLEVGYGVDNIFKFFRFTFLHRLTYLDNPNTRSFGVFFSARFNL